MKTKNILTLIFGILFISSVSAFAVSSEYWDENPITITKGETTQIKVYLQNMAGIETVFAKGVITEGADIARFISEPEYAIEPGTKAEVLIEVKIPKNIQIEQDYIRLAFETTSEEGTFALKNSIERVIPVKIVTEEEKGISKDILYYVIISASIIIIVLIILLLKKKNKKKKKRKR